MSQYEHTQVGVLMRGMLGSMAAAAAVIALVMAFVTPSFAIVPSLVALILLLSLSVFHSLTVIVSRDQIKLVFGVGLIRKRFLVADVVGAAIVRNRWWYGWGIRITPHGWLYNVSGLDAVEIALRNGRKRRIGTDEPAELLAAIEAVIGGK